MNIHLIRHGESLANTNEQDPIEIGDCNIDLSAKGISQACDLGKTLPISFKDALVYCSPYKRTRQTLANIFLGANLKPHEQPVVLEDVRLREVERGYESEASQFHLREPQGWFYYRHNGGESPADCFDRSSTFMDSLFRELARTKREDVYIVCHGMVIRTFVMRWLHLTVEQFNAMDNPDNCDVVTIRPITDDKEALFRSGQWEVIGINERNYFH